MPDSESADEYVDAIDFLRERLNRGNDCMLAGNARGAIVYYDSALASFPTRQHINALRSHYHALWTNKALAHQHLREPVKSQEAAMIANGLLAADQQD